MCVLVTCKPPLKKPGDKCFSDHSALKAAINISFFGHLWLQVRGSTRYRRRHTVAKFTHLPSADLCPVPLPLPPDPSPSPAPSFRKGPSSHRSHRHCQTTPRNHTLTCSSNRDLCQAREEEEGARPNGDPEAARAGWAGHRSRSLFCLPSVGGALSAGSTPFPANSRCSSLARPSRLKVEALEGAEETDVDTGRKVDSGGEDLSVVSAYSCPQPRPRPRPLSAPPQDPAPSFSAQSTSSLPHLVSHAPLWDHNSAPAVPSDLHRSRPQNTHLPFGAGEGGWSEGTELIGSSGSRPAEAEQEFYI